jgi:hypothetical protein
MKKKKWFCVSDIGELVALGNCADFDEAEISAEGHAVNPIWMIDEDDARLWLKTLKEIEQ